MRICYVEAGRGFVLGAALLREFVNGAVNFGEVYYWIEVDRREFDN
jgi:hypothetical protein